LEYFSMTREVFLAIKLYVDKRVIDSVRNRTVAQRIELGPSGDMSKPTGKVRIPPKRGQSAFKEEVFERSSTPSQIVQVPKRAPSLFKQRRTKQ